MIIIKDMNFKITVIGNPLEYFFGELKLHTVNQITAKEEAVK